jgi:predicted GNAT family acetyltransferase
VGIGGVQTNPSNTSELWVHHVSVEAKHQGKGYARNIIESIYDYALRRDQQVVPSSFTTEGQRLKAIFSRMNGRYPQAASSLPFKDF